MDWDDYDYGSPSTSAVGLSAKAGQDGEDETEDMTDISYHNSPPASAAIVTSASITRIDRRAPNEIPYQEEELDRSGSGDANPDSKANESWPMPRAVAKQSSQRSYREGSPARNKKRLMMVSPNSSRRANAMAVLQSTQTPLANSVAARDKRKMEAYAKERKDTAAGLKYQLASLRRDSQSKSSLSSSSTDNSGSRGPKIEVTPTPSAQYFMSEGVNAKVRSHPVSVSITEELPPRPDFNKKDAPSDSLTDLRDVSAIKHYKDDNSEMNRSNGNESDKSMLSGFFPTLPNLLGSMSKDDKSESPGSIDPADSTVTTLSTTTHYHQHQIRNVPSPTPVPPTPQKDYPTYDTARELAPAMEEASKSVVPVTESMVGQEVVSVARTSSPVAKEDGGFMSRVLSGSADYGVDYIPGDVEKDEEDPDTELDMYDVVKEHSDTRNRRTRDAAACMGGIIIIGLIIGLILAFTGVAGSGGGGGSGDSNDEKEQSVCDLPTSQMTVFNLCECRGSASGLQLTTEEDDFYRFLDDFYVGQGLVFQLHSRDSCAPENQAMLSVANFQRWGFTQEQVDALLTVPQSPREEKVKAVSEQQLIQRFILQVLYLKLNGPNWVRDDQWLQGGSLCSWYGVSCGTFGQIETLRLSSNGLHGNIDPILSKLTGLRSLDLSMNRITGPIPSGLAQLTSLYSLDLSGNELSGSISTQLGTLSSLETLSLSENQLDSTIPKELGDLQQMRVLRLDHNKLVGPIWPDLGAISSLRVLDLNHNQLDGELPLELGNFQFMDTLDLSSNKFHGLLPNILGSYDSLSAFLVDNNQVTGFIHEDFCQKDRSQTLLVLDCDAIQANCTCCPASVVCEKDLPFIEHFLGGY